MLRIRREKRSFGDGMSEKGTGPDNCEEDKGRHTSGFFSGRTTKGVGRVNPLDH